jgi:cobalt/nickel transport system ATP-binding protein
MSHHYIEIKDLTFKYSDGTKAIDKINLFVSHGESVAILGSNGAGKSTFIKHLNGVLFPSSGTVNIGGVTVTKKTVKRIREKVGIVFQNSDNQLFMPSVYENVAFGLKNMQLEDKEIREAVEDALMKVGCLHLIDKHPFKLSGGEKRKVCIASIIASNPEILVLDEPTAEVDPKGVSDIVKILNSFVHTKIVSTHNLKFAKAVCKRGVIFHQGQIIFDGNIDEIIGNHKLLKDAEIFEDY